MVVLSSPVTVELALTRCCNHQCVHCYNPYRPKNDLRSCRSIDDLKIIMDQLQKNKVLKVVITGGEPLTDKELTIEAVKMLISLGIEVSLNTNLTLINQTFIDNLKAVDEDICLFVSIPSLNCNSYDLITNNSHGYSDVLRGLQLCLDNDLKVGINIVVTKLTEYDFQSISELLEKYPNIVYVSLSPVVPPEYDFDNNLFKITNEDLLLIRDILLQLNDKYKIPVGSSIPLPICIIGTELYRRGHSSTCCAGRTDCAIDFESGDIFACSGSNESFGNVYEQGLESSWINMSKWRDESLIAQECKKCKYLPLCSGKCRMMTMHNTGYVTNPEINLDLQNLFNQKPIMDYSAKYSLNTSLKTREEEFGVVLFLNNGHLFGSKKIYSIIQIMKQLGKFSLEDLSTFIKLDENFLDLFNIFCMLRYVVESE